MTARAYTIWRVDLDYGEDDSSLPAECEECGDTIDVQR
jgi:hypothetical protein